MIKHTMKAILSNFFRIRFVAKIAVNTIPHSFIREFMGREFLSPIQRFALDGYGEIFKKDLTINPQGCIVILGGYIGDSAQFFLKHFDCKLYVFEPISEYYDLLISRFSSVSRLKVLPIAVSNVDGNISLGIAGESTGQFVHSEESQLVACKDIHKIILGISESIELLEVNIEGGEYAVLSRLIETGDIQRVKSLLIQFHNVDFEHELFRAKLRKSLHATHFEVFNYEWVWERWDLRKQ